MSRFIDVSRWSELFKIIGSYDMNTQMTVYYCRGVDYYRLECSTYHELIFKKCVDMLDANGYDYYESFNSKRDEHVVSIVL